MPTLGIIFIKQISAQNNKATQGRPMQHRFDQKLSEIVATTVKIKGATGL